MLFEDIYNIMKILLIMFVFTNAAFVLAEFLFSSNDVNKKKIKNKKQKDKLKKYSSNNNDGFNMIKNILFVLSIIIILLLIMFPATIKFVMVFIYLPFILLILLNYLISAYSNIIDKFNILFISLLSSLYMLCNKINICTSNMTVIWLNFFLLILIMSINLHLLLLYLLDFFTNKIKMSMPKKSKIKYDDIISSFKIIIAPFFFVISLFCGLYYIIKKPYSMIVKYLFKLSIIISFIIAYCVKNTNDEKGIFIILFSAIIIPLTINIK